MTKTEIAFVVDIRGEWMDINWKDNGEPVMLSFKNPTAETKAALHEAMVNEDIDRICKLWDDEKH